MIFVIKKEKKYINIKQFNFWFAWRPVIFTNYDGKVYFVWFSKIKRKLVEDDVNDCSYWEYIIDDLRS